MNFDEMKSMSSNDNWCVIIQSYPSKLKKDLVQRVSEIFDLEKKETKQAISNTPLILIDGLSFAMAASIKNFFSRLGATVETTNHDMIKKNCFQVVWPEVPDLSFFLKDETPVSRPTESSKEQPDETKSGKPASKSPFSFLRQTQGKKKTPEPPASGTGDGEPSLPKLAESDAGKLATPEPESQNPPSENGPAPVLPGSTGEPEVETPAVSGPDGEESPMTDPGAWERKAKELSERLAKIQDEKQKTSVESSAGLDDIKTKLKDRLMAEHAKNEQEVKDQGPVQSVPEEKSGGEASDLPETGEPNQGLAQRVQDLETELRQKDIELGETDSIRDRCQVLEAKVKELESQREQAMNSADGEIQNLNGQRQSLEGKVADLEAQLTQAQAVQSQLENISADFSREKSEWTAKIGEMENQIREKSGKLQESENHGAALQTQVDELKGKVAELNDLSQRRQSEWDEQMRQNGLAAETAKNELARLGQEFESERGTFQIQTGELNEKIRGLEDQIKNQQQALQERDQILAGLEKQLEDLIREHQEVEKIRGENARFNEDRAALVQKFEGQLAEQESKLAKMQEDFRRTRSRTERKLTAANRELGEWVREVDSLRGGLQKLIRFLASDMTSLEPERKITSSRSISMRSEGGAQGGTTSQEK